MLDVRSHWRLNIYVKSMMIMMFLTTSSDLACTKRTKTRWSFFHWRFPDFQVPALQFLGWNPVPWISHPGWKKSPPGLFLIFNRESQTKPSFVTGILCGGGRPKVYQTLKKKGSSKSTKGPTNQATKLAERRKVWCEENPRFPYCHTDWVWASPGEGEKWWCSLHTMLYQ